MEPRNDRLDQIRQIAEQYRQGLEQHHKYKPAYYGYPERWGVDPTKIIKNYDPSYPIDREKEYHPLAGKCRGIAVGLANRLTEEGIPARAVGGWFRQPGNGRHYPEEYGVGHPYPGPAGKQHWWVEADGYYIDVSADQFFPEDPSQQIARRVSITPKEGALESLWPYRRRPLYRNVPLPQNLENLAQTIVKSQRPNLAKLNLAEWRGKERFIQWLKTWGPKKFGLSERDIIELSAVIQHEDVDANLGNLAQVRRLLGEIVPDSAEHPAGDLGDIWDELNEQQREALTKRGMSAIVAQQKWNEMTPRQRTNVLDSTKLPEEFVVSLWSSLSENDRTTAIYGRQFSEAFIEANWDMFNDKEKETIVTRRNVYATGTVSLAFIERHWADMPINVRKEVTQRADLSDDFIRNHWAEFDDRMRTDAMRRFDQIGYRQIEGVDFNSPIRAFNLSLIRTAAVPLAKPQSYELYDIIVARQTLGYSAEDRPGMIVGRRGNDVYDIAPITKQFERARRWQKEGDFTVFKDDPSFPLTGLNYESIILDQVMPVHFNDIRGRIGKLTGSMLQQYLQQIGLETPTRPISTRPDPEQGGKPKTAAKADYGHGFITPDGTYVNVSTKSGSPFDWAKEITQNPEMLKRYRIHFNPYKIDSMTALEEAGWIVVDDRQFHAGVSGGRLTLDNLDIVKRVLRRLARLYPEASLEMNVTDIFGRKGLRWIDVDSEGNPNFASLDQDMPSQEDIDKHVSPQDPGLAAEGFDIGDFNDQSAKLSNNLCNHLRKAAVDAPLGRDIEAWLFGVSRYPEYLGAYPDIWDSKPELMKTFKARISRILAGIKPPRAWPRPGDENKDIDKLRNRLVELGFQQKTDHDGDTYSLERAGEDTKSIRGWRLLVEITHGIERENIRITAVDMKGSHLTKPYFVPSAWSAIRTVEEIIRNGFKVLKKLNDIDQDLSDRHVAPQDPGLAAEGFL